MTVVHPNHIVGINSITVQTGDSLSVHKSDGSLIRTIVSNTGVSTFHAIEVSKGGGDLTVGISTLVVDNSAGKIGIGTVPARTLQVFAATPQVNLKSASGGTCELQFGDTGDEVRANIIYNSTDNYLGFNGYNNTERFRILSNGRIGINTSEATSALQIYADDLGEGTAKGQIFLKDTAAYNASPTSGIVFQGHHASNNSQAIFAGIRGLKANAADGDYDGCLAFDVRKHGAVAYEAMRITEDGKIGIGTNTVTDSNVFVEVVGSASQKARIQFDNKPIKTGDDDELGGFIVRNNADSVGYIFCRRDTANDAAYLIFGTQATGGSVSERLRITSGGDTKFVSTGGIQLPRGTTSERPTDTSSTTPYMRWNSTNSGLEVYNGNEWVEIITDYFPSGSTAFS